MSGIVSQGSKALNAFKAPASGNDSAKQAGDSGDGDSTSPDQKSSSNHFILRQISSAQDHASGALKAVAKGIHSVAAPIHRQISRSAPSEQTEEELPDVPPDSKLQNMNVIVRKQLRGVSIREFYETVWSEGNRTDKEPFYGPWLAASGKNEVKVEDWTFAEGGEGFRGGWCGEEYSQMRVVTFKFTRTTHLYTGPPVAGVKHTQYCRVEEDDRCILSMTVQMDGIPFADCFEVEIRWVASRVGKNDLLIEVGLFVNFVKSTIVASKIKAGTTEETTKGQLDLFENVKGACHAQEGDAVEEKAYEPEPIELFSCSHLGEYFSRLFGGSQAVLANRNDEIAVGLRGADTKLKTVVSIVEKSSVDSKKESELLNEIASLNESLDTVLSTLR